MGGLFSSCPDCNYEVECERRRQAAKTVVLNEPKEPVKKNKNTTNVPQEFEGDIEAYQEGGKRYKQRKQRRATRRKQRRS